MIGVIGGFVAGVLGEWDVLLQALASLVVLDYVTRLLKSWNNKSLSSEIGFTGLVKKVFIFVMVAASEIAQNVIGDAIPLREVVIMFFISNEGISLLENAPEFVPIPEKLKQAFSQIREDEEAKKKRLRMTTKSKGE